MVNSAEVSRRQIAIDANLLLLLVVGTCDPWLLKSHRRLGDYTVQDFYLVRDFVASYRSVVTTSHVLTEVSNLADAATGNAKQVVFSQLSETIMTLDERLVPASSVSTCSEFSIFGLTDAALSMVCIETPLLTQDGRLAAHLQRKGLKVWTLADLKAFRALANNA